MPELQHGYHVLRAGTVAFAAHCQDCSKQTCECVLEALAAARRHGGGVVVYGPGGRVLQRREAA